MSAIYISKITDFIYVSRAPLYEADQRELIAQGFQCVVNLQEAPQLKPFTFQFARCLVCRIKCKMY